MTSPGGFYRVRIGSFFEAAHNLRSYKGKPEPLHGHSWKAEVDLDAPGLDKEGMAFDFAEIRQALETLTKRLDHAYINEVPPFTDLAPSAENIARWICGELRAAVERKGCRIVQVRVWEGPHAAGSFRPR